MVEEERYDSGRVLIASEVSQECKLILDLGFFFFICPFKYHFIEYYKYDKGIVIMGNNAMCRMIRIRNVKLELHDGSFFKLKQVRHVPDLKRNLISIRMIDQMGYVAKVQHNVLSVIKGSLVLLKGVRKNGLYMLEGNIVTIMASVSSTANVDKNRLCHLRLGHISLKDVTELLKHGLLGSDKIEDLVVCEAYILGKSTRVNFKSSVHTSRSILDYVHSELSVHQSIFCL